MSVLKVKDLKKHYPGKKPFIAVDGISFALKEGEILGLLGHNGAGKTTTIQMLMSTLAPTSGEIFYFNKNLAKHRSEVLQHVSFASTYVSLPWSLTVEQNLNVYSLLFSKTPKETREERDQLLKRFGVYSKLDRRISELSSGQITRLMLIKAFMVKPKIVLLDEPTASLDPEIAKDVIAFVQEKRQNNGVSILFTSHNMSEVSAVCDRVLFLKKGKIIADDIPANLAKRVVKSRLHLQITEGIETAELLASHLQVSAAKEHTTLCLELDEADVAKYLSALAAKGVVYSSINIIQPTLEDFFYHAATNEGETK